MKGSQSSLSIAAIVRAEFEPVFANKVNMLALLSDQHAHYAQLIGDSLKNWQQEGQLQISTRAEADHLFTPLADQKWLIDQVSNWVRHLDLMDSDYE